MAFYNPLIEKRMQIALATVSRFAEVVSAYIFGSQVEGTADNWSDIDLAIFIEGLGTWDIHTRARLSAQVQKEAGDDIEVHFLPAEALRKRDAAGFAAWVTERGVAVPVKKIH